MIIRRASLITAGVGSAPAAFYPTSRVARSFASWPPPQRWWLPIVDDDGVMTGAIPNRDVMNLRHSA